MVFAFNVSFVASIGSSPKGRDDWCRGDYHAGEWRLFVLQRADYVGCVLFHRMVRRERQDEWNLRVAGAKIRTVCP